MLPGLITVRLPGRWGIKVILPPDDAASGPGTYQSLLVTLPETTPVLEAANLQSDLERAGIHPWGWIINNSLSIAQTQSPLLCQRALQERPQIEVVKNQHASRIALVPVMAAEPTGIEKLRELVV
jgi:arsenite-transporting ATPase